ncbi:MAG: PAS domain-containing protein [Novosphingobium sp.]
MPSSREQDHSRFLLGLDDGRIRGILDTLPQMVWSTTLAGMADFFNRQWYEFTGLSHGDTDGEAWIDVLHPEDRPHIAAAWRESVTSGQPYEVEYRMRHHDGEYRWMLARGVALRDSEGAIERWFGTCTNVDQQKCTEERLGLIALELSHRIKNIFSVVGSIISLSVPRRSEFRPLAESIMARITALARAHDHFRPDVGDNGIAGARDLKGLIAVIMAPYQNSGSSEQRLLVEGDDVDIGTSATTALALLLHELATNSVKYGAFSNAGGQISIALENRGGIVMIRWRERGGPAILEKPEKRSFGTKLAQRAATAQLRGEIVYRWERTGLEVDISIPAESMG